MKIDIRRPWVGAVAGAAVIAVAAGVYVWQREGSSSAAATSQVTTRLVSVSTGTVRQSVSTTGTLAPADVEDVSFGTAATVTGVAVTVGQKVTKGQVLGTIDPVSLAASVAQAELGLANAKATLAATDSSTSAAQLAADKAAVTSAQTSVTSAKAARARATLRSPISGVVAEVNVTKGESSAGGGSTSQSSSSGSSGGGTGSGGTGSGGTGSGGSSGGSSSSGSTSSSSSADFVVIGTAAWTVSATVDDTQIGLLAVGDQAQITTDNVTGTVFGTVSSVSVLSSSSSGSASYPVTIAVTGTPSGLHDGASATVSIIYKQLANVLTVPALAVHTATGGSYVYVDTNGTKTKRTVTTGLSSGGTTQIVSGLTSGQQVYVDVQTVRRTGTGSTDQRTGYFPGGGTGNFPGGGTGNFPGGGTGNFPGGGTGGR